MAGDIPSHGDVNQIWQEPNPNTEIWLNSLPVAPRLVDLPVREALMPISRVEAFRTHWVSVGKDPRIFDLVVENIRYATPEFFAARLANMARKIDEFVGDDSYAMVIDSEGKSGGYIANAITPTLLQAPLSREEAMFRRVNEALPVRKVVIVDDASYSGGYAALLYNRVRSAFPNLDPHNILISHVGMTQLSLKALGKAIKEGASIDAGFRIPLLTDVLSTNDINDMTRDTSWAGNPYHSVLTFLPHRVPDNFCGDFRARIGTRDNQGGRFFLIDDFSESGIRSPYHK